MGEYANSDVIFKTIMKYFLHIILYLIFQVSLIAGDGIGPEISNSVKIVFEAVKVIVMT